MKIFAALIAVVMFAGCESLPDPYIPNALDYRQGEKVVNRIRYSMNIELPRDGFEIDATRYVLTVKLIGLPDATFLRIARQIDQLKREQGIRRVLELEHYRDGKLEATVRSDDPEGVPFRLPKLPIQEPARRIFE